MSNVTNSQIHIFLVQPLDKHIHKEMIVYADTEQQARKAAALAATSANTLAEHNEVSATIYLDTGMSICIEITPDIIVLDSQSVKTKYNEVMYHLIKDVAQRVVVENVF